MSQPASQVLVLDDDPAVLVSLERLLVTHGYTARTHQTPDALFGAGPPPVPACLLLDQNLGPVKGTEVHAELLRRGWLLPTIFLTADWDTHTVVQAMRGGADDYLTKPYDPAELLQTVARSLQRAQAIQLAADELACARARAATLTPRERAIVGLVVAGMLNKQIADHLGLALVTVKVHRGRAMQKLGARNPADLARLSALVGITG